MYRMPILSLFRFALAAVTLGIARCAIDEFVKIATSKIPMGSQTLLRDRPSAQCDVARAESLVRAARAGLVEAVRAQWEEIDAGHAASLTARAGVRLATTFVGETSVQAIDRIYNAAGGSAILESGRLDRCLRDARVAVQQIGLTTGTYELAGKVLLGLEPGTPRF
jgi:indole-3-acetate monooxygenase